MDLAGRAYRRRLKSVSLLLEPASLRTTQRIPSLSLEALSPCKLKVLWRTRSVAKASKSSGVRGVVTLNVGACAAQGDDESGEEHCTYRKRYENIARPMNAQFQTGETDKNDDNEGE